MTLTPSPAQLSGGQRGAINYGQRPASLHDLHRRAVSRQANHDGSPRSGADAAVSGNNNSRGAGELAVRSRAIETGDDTSDDEDFPEPIKFSASVKELLGEDASGLDGSPKRTNWDEPRGSSQYRRDSSGIGGEGPRQREKQVRIESPGLRQQRASASPPLRIVRVGSETRRSPRDGGSSSFLSRMGDAGYDLSDAQRNELITPAPRARSVRTMGSRSTTRSPSASIPSANNSSSDASRLEERSFLEDGTRRGLEERSYARPGLATVTRTRVDIDTGVNGSLRVKRVGKLSGSFLNGPARRGVLRRQSEEEPSADYHEESYLGSASRNKHETQDPDTQLEDSMLRTQRSSERRRESPRLSENGIVPSSTRSPESLRRVRSLRSSGSGSALKTRSPLSAEEPKSLIDSRHNGLSPKARPDVKLVYRVPPPPELPAKHDQENDPPPTFKRTKPHGFGLLDKVDKVSVLYDEDKLVRKPIPEPVSPRRPLGKMSNNTPRRPAPPPPPKMSVLETATAVAGAATTSQSRKKRAQITINRKAYTRLDCIGRGGSSRVYRVMAENCKIFALKRVNLEGVDPLALAGYKGEIELLKKLKNVGRVVQMYDFEISEEKHTLTVLMEMGECDLHRLILEKSKSEDAVFDPVFTRFYWREMLECVQAVHDYDIVHSDLKPANFLLVQGRLKLIDFGIANMIEDHTVNVYREQQIGTPNFMAPEALIDCNASRGLPATAGKLMKVGKPSDVWSLGCILYQMVYGKPPFGHITNFIERMMAILNTRVAINFPEQGLGNVPVPRAVMRTLKGCLQRDQTLRPTITKLLSPTDPFLYPEAQPQQRPSMDGAVPISQEMLGRILTNVVNHCRARGPPTDEELAGWPAGFFVKIKAAMEDD